MTDMFDPKVATAYNNIMHYQNTVSYTDGFNRTPWILGITPDDTDYLFGITAVRGNFRGERASDLELA